MRPDKCNIKPNGHRTRIRLVGEPRGDRHADRHRPAGAGPGVSPWFAARRLALKRRLALAAGRGFDPYPPPPTGTALSPSAAHIAAYARAPLRLAWARAGIADPRDWQATARAKLAALMGYDAKRPPPEARHFTDSRLDAGAGLGRLLRRRVYLRVREATDVPVDLVWQESGAEPLPVMLCLQGTNAGAHLSWGEVRMPADPLKIAAGLDHARQAAARGYAAVCIEQACFGERCERQLAPRSADPCIDAANHALLLGRTLLGERASDLSSVIDWLAKGAPGPALDMARLHVMGNSAGGTTAVFTAALDKRIGSVLAGGCVGFFRETIARRADPSGQNVIPGILDWLEFDDVVALIAPRPVFAISGDADHIFPAAGVEAVIDSARAVYAALGAGHAIAAAKAQGGHRFYPEQSWQGFEALLAATRD